MPYLRAIVAGYSPDLTVCVRPPAVELKEVDVLIAEPVLTVAVTGVDVEPVDPAEPETGMTSFSPTRIRSEVLPLAALIPRTENTRDRGQQGEQRK